MNEYGIMDALACLLQTDGMADNSDAYGDEAFIIPHVERVSAFDKAKFLNKKRGLFVRLEDGSEFQLTVAKIK